jgi:hypothetical protein
MVIREVPAQTILLLDENSKKTMIEPGVFD